MPLLRGRDVTRYGKSWDGLYLVGTHNGLKEIGRLPVDIKRYPALKVFLDGFKGELDRRADKGDTPYHLRNCAYWDDFAKPKLIWAETMRIWKGSDARFPRFSFDDEGLFTDKTCFFATGSDLKYILANLNSTVGRYQCSKEVAILDNGGYLMQKIYLEKIRIAPANEKQKKEVTALVDRILAVKKKDSEADTTALEAEIDQLVYKLYGLTEEEIAIVEGREEKAKGEGEEKVIGEGEGGARRRGARGSAAVGGAPGGRPLPDDDEELE